MKKIKLIIKIDGELFEEFVNNSSQTFQANGKIFTDYNKLLRVLLNLLNNAYRYTSVGGEI
jgi:signal transduction histidine kinase